MVAMKACDLSLLFHTKDNTYRSTIVAILVVDDSRLYRNIIKSVLSERGTGAADILDAGDGEEALSLLLEREDIDLVLVDWNMPKMSGLELVTRVRQVERYSATPIIMITSEAAKYNVMEALKAGVSDYVVKPITGKILGSKIDTFLKR